MPSSAVSKLGEEDFIDHQRSDLNRCEIRELLTSVEASATVSLSRDQVLIDQKEGPERKNNQLYKKSMGLRKAFTATEWEDSNDHDGYYDSHANTNASSEKRKETKERTYATNSESCEATEQEQGRNDCFSIEEGFYSG